MFHRVIEVIRQLAELRRAAETKKSDGRVDSLRREMEVRQHQFELEVMREREAWAMRLKDEQEKRAKLSAALSALL